MHTVLSVGEMLLDEMSLILDDLLSESYIFAFILLFLVAGCLTTTLFFEGNQSESFCHHMHIYIWEILPWLISLTTILAEVNWNIENTKTYDDDDSKEQRMQRMRRRTEEIENCSSEPAKKLINKTLTIWDYIQRLKL